ncbi:MAG: hypothetical protein JRE16_11210 [Deltaproteobacteria bacterium]|jgi:hypothetical protein|nr:hypothetical protein [Deltaproteobacteria bacterium]
MTGKQDLLLIDGEKREVENKMLLPILLPKTNGKKLGTGLKPAKSLFLLWLPDRTVLGAGEKQFI